MKTTDNFKTAISNFLESLGKKDPLFAKTLEKPNKNIDDCLTYILNAVQKSGMNGFADEDIYSMAIHYYDEDDIEIGKAVNCKVVVNHTVELTEEEKEDARKEAHERLVKKQMDIISGKGKKVKKQEENNVQQSLF